MAHFVDIEDSAPDDEDQDDVVIESLLGDDELDNSLIIANRKVSSRRRIEDYMDIRRLRDELDDPFFNFD